MSPSMPYSYHGSGTKYSGPIYLRIEMRGDTSDEKERNGAATGDTGGGLSAVGKASCYEHCQAGRNELCQISDKSTASPNRGDDVSQVNVVWGRLAENR